MQNTQFLLLISSNNPLNWSNMRQGFPLLNNKIVTQGKFDTDTKIFYCILLNNFDCIGDIITESRITTIS